MESAAEMREYLVGGSATEQEIDRFADVHWIRERRDECYRLWARLLRHRRTPYRRNQVFDFSIELKAYLRIVSGGEIIDADPPANAVSITADNFVKFVVRYLEDSF